MIKFAAWNVRGLNLSLKQNEVQNVIRENGLSLCAILESHVEGKNIKRICNKVFKDWEWVSNADSCGASANRARIIVGWDSTSMDVNVLTHDDQVMHMQILFKGTKNMMYCSIVYAANYYVTRRGLWKNLKMHKCVVKNDPWVLMGDFNTTLHLDEQTAGSSRVTASMREFQDCIHEIEVSDVNRNGMQFTWNQKPRSGVGLLKKLDRVMSNGEFIDLFPQSCASFKPYRISDHCPCVLVLVPKEKPKRSPFKFSNFLVHKTDFLEVVRKGWSLNVKGVAQFRVVKKLKALKHNFRSMLYKQGNLHEKVKVLRAELDKIQALVDQNPDDQDIRASEEKCLKEYQQACIDEEGFLKQKAKVHWLAVGDANTRYFHNYVKGRNHRARIHSIKDMNGMEWEGDQMIQQFVSHYNSFLGGQHTVSRVPSDDLFTSRLNHHVALAMIAPVEKDEIKSVIFSMNDNKAPGPDGYTSAFFKKAWDVVGNDVVLAVQDFFNTSRLLQEINHTNIALIPKVPTPNYVTDYRPIACCNVLYKCISKIIANRLKKGLNDIVSINQSAFVPDRKISDNILLTQELLHNYHRNVGPPRCAWKIDIQKAYDTVDWMFLEKILLGFGLHPTMVRWIMVCVTTPSFSICINGETHGYFRGTRGLRQGDPLSPYLFTLVMEVLTLLFAKMVTVEPFSFHNKCDKLGIVNLCFADDLFIFAKGDSVSAECVLKVLKRFADMSGLTPSNHKSTVYFCHVPPGVKKSITDLLPFEEGKLPVRYLGVPLITKRVRYTDCSALIERMDKRISLWLNKFLSFAGRLQLIRSVLSSLHVYWSSVFFLPSRIVAELELRMRNFLWAKNEQCKGHAKVAWKKVCLPKHEGGLGIRRIGDMNKGLMVMNIWRLIQNQESLWVRWIHTVRLRGRNFWEIRTPSKCSWSWRNILSVRDSIRGYIWSKVGNGKHTNIWYDYWCEVSPLIRFITPRAIRDAGLCLSDTIDRIIYDGVYHWPVGWLDRYPQLASIITPILNDNHDQICWKEGGSWIPFSATNTWNAIRYTEPLVDWSNCVWFGQCIPKHAFIFWLVCRRKLVTQDRIIRWKNRKCLNMLCCSLCYSNFDSHTHLFFECDYSKQVWKLIRDWASMNHVSPSWQHIIQQLIADSKSKSIVAIIGRLVVASAAYFIWQERNARAFNEHPRPPEILAKHILRTVQYRLLGLKLKRTARVVHTLNRWGVKLIK